MKRIRVSAAAERDLDGIWHYVALRSGSIETANRVVDEVSETFPLFTHAPESGTRRDEIEPGVRGFPVGTYIIYYRETKRYIEIARVLHGTRDQRSAFRKS